MTSRRNNPEQSNALLLEILAELEAVARRAMAGERAGHTLQATAVVHEAFLRASKTLGMMEPSDPQSARYFLAVGAQAVRHVLIDHARARVTLTRGGGMTQLPIDQALDTLESGTGHEVANVDEALKVLRSRRPELAELIDDRYFSGLSSREIAATTGQKMRTLDRRLHEARQLLGEILGDGRP